MPRPAYGFLFAPVIYLIEYVLTFTLRHGNSRSPRTASSSSERHATDRRTDRHRASFNNDPSLWRTQRTLLATQNLLLLHPQQGRQIEVE